MNKRKLALVGVVLVLAVLGWPVLAMEWWEEEQTGSVQRTQGLNSHAVANWEDGFVEAEAIGTADIRTAVNAAQAKMMAEEAARVRAYAQLAEVVEGFNITSDITVENGLIGRSEQRLQLTAFLKGAQVISTDTVWLPDGTPLSTVKVGILLARSHPGIGAPPPERPERRVSLAEVVAPLVDDVTRHQRQENPPRTFVSVSPSPATAYTGLIVDARGLDGSASLAPRILTEDGAEVWAFANAEPDYALVYGVVEWVHDMDSARSKARVGDTPMVISARGAVGPTAETIFKSDFVISGADAAFLLAANEGTGFLQKCAVVIII